ncbi:MAG: SDR family NAD(P)-dependent oxidoreductase [Reichenbachiella sp.]
MTGTNSSTAEQITEGINLSGKTYLITGCNSGIGLETMRVLALRGAKVYGLARSLEKATQACESIIGNAVPMVCDLSDPISIKVLIDTIKEPIDGIIANAGVMALQERRVEHGIEYHMLVNHMGHYMLITRLLKSLKVDGRVVVVSSAAHAYARGKGLILDDLSWERPYKPWAAYGHSKLANILFSKELSKRLSVGQTSNSLHPGVIDSSLWRHLPSDEAERMKNNFGAKSTALGAATSVFLAVHPSVSGVTGAYFSNGKIGKATALAQDPIQAKKLWDVSEELAVRLLKE